MCYKENRNFHIIFKDFMRIKDIDSLPDDNPIKKQLKAKGITKTSKSEHRSDFEHELQSRAVEIFRIKYPSHKTKLFAIPNGGARDKVTGAKLKREGVVAGAWDLFLAVPSGNYHGCFIETKWQKRKLSNTQKTFRANLDEFYHFFVYRSIDQFLREIENYLTIQT